jgi:hypothetical protein
MKLWIKTAGLRAGLAAMALALGANAAHAALLERDLLLDRDHAITYDTDTQFEWLDLTKTEGLNYNDALASRYVTEFGFHIATVAEVLQLWADVGVSPGDSYENSPGGVELINLLGCTAQCVRGGPAAQGWMDMGDPLMTAYSFVQYASSSPPGPYMPGVQPIDANMNYVPFVSRASTNPFLNDDTGAWLVRSAVPEPATWAMMITGFGLVGASLRRRRVAVAA